LAKRRHAVAIKGRLAGAITYVTFDLHGTATSISLESLGC